MEPSSADTAQHDRQQIMLVAGYDASQQPVMEQVEVRATRVIDEFILEHSPAFVRNLAAGDLIRYPAATITGHELLRRSGNLSIRVFSKHNMDALEQSLSPEIELLGGQCDRHSEVVLVYSIHASIGFQAIETVLDRCIGQCPGSIWYYGNVYDPEDGSTPLNWWQTLSEEV